MQSLIEDTRHAGSQATSSSSQNVLDELMDSVDVNLLDDLYDDHRTRVP